MRIFLKGLTTDLQLIFLRNNKNLSKGKGQHSS